LDEKMVRSWEKLQAVYRAHGRPQAPPVAAARVAHASSKLNPDHALALAKAMPPAPEDWPDNVDVPIVHGESVYSPKHGYINPNNPGPAALETQKAVDEWEWMQRANVRRGSDGGLYDI
jgi:hypothetical protein